MNLGMYGTAALNYLKTNAVDIAATGAVAAGWTAVVTVGPKVVVGTCLVGGGMFASFVVHEAATRIFRFFGSAAKKFNAKVEQTAGKDAGEGGMRRVVTP